MSRFIRKMPAKDRPPPGSGAKGKDFETQDAADRIDAFIHAHLDVENLKPNPEIRDEQFVRRIYLWPSLGVSHRFGGSHSFSSVRIG